MGRRCVKRERGKEGGGKNGKEQGKERGKESGSTDSCMYVHLTASIPPTHTSAITKFVSNTTEFPSLMAFREAGPVRYPPPCGLSSWGVASTACQPSNPAGRSGRASHTSFHTWKFLAVGGREGGREVLWKKPQPNLMKFMSIVPKFS